MPGTSCSGGGDRRKGDDNDDDAATVVEELAFDTTALLALKAALCIFESVEICVESSSQMSDLKKAQSPFRYLCFFFALHLFLKKNGEMRKKKEKKLSTLSSSLSFVTLSPLFF